MSTFQFNEEPFFIEFCLLVMPIRESARGFRWSLDPLILSPGDEEQVTLLWSEGDDVESHSYAPWSSCNQKPCLQFLCNIRYGSFLKQIYEAIS